ncbi:MAG: DUF447 family protein [Planctomycetales bacterium]|nr:DUF447 family protein [Planctomycetales bacterium]
MILEGIVTTLNPDGTVNVSPMGPHVDREVTTMRLRPYHTSRTWQNLREHPEGVLHVTDDVELFARAAVGKLESLPPLSDAWVVNGKVLDDACRSYEFRVTSADDSAERITIECEIVHKLFQREFFGFNRAHFAVLEAAIQATRLQWLTRDSVLGNLRRLRPLVEKTGGDREKRAFAFLEEFVAAAEHES